VTSGAEDQLAALGRVAARLEAASIDYWLFGGWAVDFYVGAITRAHDDVDLAVWLADAARLAALFADDGWEHAPLPDEDGGTGYERGGVRLELTFLVRGEDGAVSTPFEAGAARWAPGTFVNDVRELRGVSARVVALEALARGKAYARDDVEDAAKDRADFASLAAVLPPERRDPGNAATR
jgi:hypothetical protein